MWKKRVNSTKGFGSFLSPPSLRNFFYDQEIMAGHLYMERSECSFPLCPFPEVIDKNAECKTLHGGIFQYFRLLCI